MINTIDIFRFLEKKDHIIKKLPITDEQKIEAIDFFTTHPNYESEIDWNRKDLTWEDLEKVIYKVRDTKSQIKKAVKQGIVGLTEGVDYVYVGSTDYEGSPVYVYIPLTWKGSRVLASDQVEPKLGTVYDGYTGAKWCISYQKTDMYWKRYLDTSCFLFLFGETVPTKKIALQLDKSKLNELGVEGFNMKTNIDIWDSHDSPIYPSDVKYLNTGMYAFISKFIYNSPLIIDKGLTTLVNLSNEGKLGSRVITSTNFEDWYHKYKNSDDTVSIDGNLIISYLNEIPFSARIVDDVTVEATMSFDKELLQQIENIGLKYKEIKGPFTYEGDYGTDSLNCHGSFTEATVGWDLMVDCYYLKSLDDMPKYFGLDDGREEEHTCAHCTLQSIKPSSPIKNLVGVTGIIPSTSAQKYKYSLEDCTGLESFEGIPSSDIPLGISLTFIDEESCNLKRLGKLPKNFRTIFLENFIMFDKSGTPFYKDFESFGDLKGIPTSEDNPLEIITSASYIDYSDYSPEVKKLIEDKFFNWLTTIPEDVYVRFNIGIDAGQDYESQQRKGVTQSIITRAFQRINNVFFAEPETYNPKISFYYGRPNY